MFKFTTINRLHSVEHKTNYTLVLNFCVVFLIGLLSMCAWRHVPFLLSKLLFNVIVIFCNG